MQQEIVDRNFLASTRLNTPDPLQTCPPEGQRLLIAWRFPSSSLSQNLTLVTLIRLWDHREKIYHFPITTTSGSIAYFVPCEDGKILTYLVQVQDVNGVCLDEWRHHFWVEKIEFES